MYGGNVTVFNIHKLLETIDDGTAQADSHGVWPRELEEWAEFAAW